MILCRICTLSTFLIEDRSRSKLIKVNQKILIEVDPPIKQKNVKIHVHQWIKQIDQLQCDHVFLLIWNRWLMLKWWAQAFWMDVPEIVVGYRNRGWVVNKVERYQTREVLQDFGVSWLLALPSQSFLSPPVHIARWAHMHRFLSVCPSVCLSHF